MRQLQALEQARDLLIRELHADDLARAARAQSDRLALRQRCSSFAYRSCRAAAHVKYQLRGALDCLWGGGKIHTALEAESRVAGQREASSKARDGGGIEHAASRNTSTVEPDTALASPPMTPPSASDFFRSAISSTSGVNSTSCPLISLRRSPLRARRTITSPSIARLDRKSTRLN